MNNKLNHFNLNLLYKHLLNLKQLKKILNNNNNNNNKNNNSKNKIYKIQQCVIFVKE